MFQYVLSHLLQVSHLKPALAAAVTQALVDDADAVLADLNNLHNRVSTTILVSSHSQHRIKFAVLLWLAFTVCVQHTWVLELVFFEHGAEASLH